MCEEIKTKKNGKSTIKKHTLNGVCPSCKNFLLFDNEASIYWFSYYCKNCGKYFLIEYEEDFDISKISFNALKRVCVVDESLVEKQKIFNEIPSLYIKSLLEKYNGEGVFGEVRD